MVLLKAYSTSVYTDDSTVGDSGMEQRQLNGAASKTTLKLAEYHENHCCTSP